MCQELPASKVTYDDEQAPHTPFFWCEECFMMLHYDSEGRATYTNYKVFPYTHEYRSITMAVRQGQLAGRGGAVQAGT